MVKLRSGQGSVLELDLNGPPEWVGPLALLNLGERVVELLHHRSHAVSIVLHIHPLILMEDGLDW